MDTLKLLWIDLRFQHVRSDLYASLSEHNQIHRLEDATAISATILKVSPLLLIFDYNYPDLPGLQALQRTKRQFPSLPIFMLTEYHSEALAIWAFRTRVWDYLVKPVMPEDLFNRIVIVAELMNSQRKDQKRPIHMPPHSIPIEMRFCNTATKSYTILRAIKYIEANYAEKISLNDVARLCHLKRFQFSRTFKKVQGLTFREYLIHRRIGKAIELLRNSHASVTDIVFAVGFSDLSYFSKTFRRYVGITPSKYRNEHLDISPVLTRSCADLYLSEIRMDM